VTWRRQKATTGFAGAIVLVLLLSAGCTKQSVYRAPVGKFRDACTVVIQATKVYLTELNKVERDQYIYSQADQMQQIRLVEIERVQVFSKDGIAVRLKALDELANYAELLYELANSNAPGTIRTRAFDLQKELNNLSGEVKALSGEDDKEFKAVAGTAMPIIGDVLQAFAEQRIEAALKKAIATGSGPVNELVNAIETDARLAYERKRTSYSGARVILVDQYNREHQKGRDADPVKLKQYADAISAGEDRWESFLTAQPSQGLEAMKSANDALVKFAGNPKPSATDLAIFVDAMEAFADMAKQVGQAAQSLKQK
jgi:hypothetical protein